MRTGLSQKHPRYVFYIYRENLFGISSPFEFRCVQTFFLERVLAPLFDCTTDHSKFVIVDIQTRGADAVESAMSTALISTSMAFAMQQTIVVLNGRSSNNQRAITLNNHQTWHRLRRDNLRYLAGITGLLSLRTPDSGEDRTPVSPVIITPTHPAKQDITRELAHLDLRMPTWIGRWY